MAKLYRPMPLLPEALPAVADSLGGSGAVYGCPYRGGKDAVAERLIARLPAATHFVDMFAGGCAMAHAALLSGRYKYVHVNDVCDLGIRLFLGGANGLYRNERRVVTRAMFEREVARQRRTGDGDPWIIIGWSWGNDMESYLWKREIEDLKIAQSRIFVASDPAERRDALDAYNNVLLDMRARHMPQPQQFRALQWESRLRRVQRLDDPTLRDLLGRLVVHHLDYREVPVEPDSVIYCDIPYRDTKAPYGAGFDHDAFYSWAEAQTERVFVSETKMPSDRFEIVTELPHASKSSASASYLLDEKLFVPKCRNEK